MAVVVDSSAVVSALLNAGQARQAVAGQVLHVPHLLDTELTSALRGMVLGKVLEPEQGRLALSAWVQLGVHRHSSTALLGRVWELRGDLSAYDASYVALAESLGCGLLTGDARISRAHGHQVSGDRGARVSPRYCRAEVRRQTLSKSLLRHGRCSHSLSSSSRLTAR